MQIPMWGGRVAAVWYEPPQYVHGWQATTEGSVGRIRSPSLAGKGCIMLMYQPEQMRERERENHRGRKSEQKSVEEKTSASKKSRRNPMVGKWLREATVYICGGEHVVISCM